MSFWERAMSCRSRKENHMGIMFSKFSLQFIIFSLCFSHICNSFWAIRKVLGRLDFPLVAYIRINTKLKGYIMFGLLSCIFYASIGFAKRLVKWIPSSRSQVHLCKSLVALRRWASMFFHPLVPLIPFLSHTSIYQLQDESLHDYKHCCFL